jgi:hypothetical protein
MKSMGNYRTCDFCGKFKGGNFNPIDHSECSKKLQEARKIKPFRSKASKYTYSEKNITKFLKSLGE